MCELNRIAEPEGPSDPAGQLGEPKPRAQNCTSGVMGTTDVPSVRQRSGMTGPDWGGLASRCGGTAIDRVLTEETREGRAFHWGLF